LTVYSSSFGEYFQTASIYPLAPPV